MEEIPDHVAKRATLQARLYLAAALILAVGLTCGAAIYVTADDEVENLSYQQMLMSKPYVRTLERMGGKYAVLSEEFSRWFEGLWHGKSLGVTLAWLSAGICFGVFLTARRLRPH